MSIPIDEQNQTQKMQFERDFFLNNSQAGGTKACNINNSSPTMPKTFDLNGSLKKAESFKNKINQLKTTLNSYGDVFERRNLPLLETAIKYTWAVSLMNDSAPLDLKAHFGTGRQFEDFGNFHYGAFLKAAGFETTEILSGASTNQAWKDQGKGWYGAWAGVKAWFSQSADHQHDTVQVERGIRYVKEIYLNAPNKDSVSDSCNAENGLQKGANNNGGGASGGGGGGFGWSCELWKFPNGKGSYYYMYRNCNYYSIP